LRTPMLCGRNTQCSFFQLLGGGKKDGGRDESGISSARLAVLPGLTHYKILSSKMLAPAVTPFLG
jgi:hypothetical protein